MSITPPTYRLKVERPTISPKITPIGYGNPRYNSMLCHKNGVLATVGSHLRWVNLEKNEILYDQQIGNSQIFQLLENSTYFMVVNFQGLVSLLLKDSFEIEHQFYLPGKQIRHSSITNNLNNMDENYISLACELSEKSKGTILVVYSLKQIQKKNYQPFWECEGNFYYPQFYKESLVLIFFNDPNPKGRKRKQTVMNKKLPIINKIVKLDNTFKQSFSYEIKSQGQIICAAQVNGAIYYLHNNKKITVFDIQRQQCAQFALQTKSYPLLIEPYDSGVAFTSTSNELGKVIYNFELKKPEYSFETIKSSAIGINHALKITNKGFYSLNDYGLHYYNRQTKKTYTQNIFNVTNCGLTFNKEGNQIAVADFTGFVRIFSVPEESVLPEPIFQVFIGKPVRSIAWCNDSNSIAVGCVGGSLYCWKIGDQIFSFAQLNHTVNILRADQSRFYVGTSDGLVKIFDSFSLILIYEFQAHSPIFYDTVEERQMFGTMQHFAQIWSMTLSPEKGSKLKIITCSQDQSEKVFSLDLNSKKAEHQQHLKGHQLAVTSIDWKQMNENIGQIYVSCSDDKVVRFRNPKDNFNILFELETSTIKEWHTLTYLSLEPNGHRVAVGSQNGYLFIFDIQKRALLFGEKVHLGGIQGLDWKNNKIVTCSSDLCLNVIEL